MVRRLVSLFNKRLRSTFLPKVSPGYSAACANCTAFRSIPPCCISSFHRLMTEVAPSVKTEFFGFKWKLCGEELSTGACAALQSSTSARAGG